MALRLVPSADADAEVSDDVIVAAATFDDRACRLVLSCYEGRVFGLCQRLLGDSRSAEDAAQDTFWKALRALSTFDPRGPAKLSTWLLTIATRTCLDELRRRRRHAGPAVASADVDADAGGARGAASAEAVVMAKERARALQERLAALPDEQRVVVVWRALLSKSERETALALGVPVGTVKSRLSRALAALNEVSHDSA